MASMPSRIRAVLAAHGGTALYLVVGHSVLALWCKYQNKTEIYKNGVYVMLFSDSIFF